MVKEDKPMEKERSFSIELKSKVNLENITLNNGSQENVLIEGTIGELEHAEFVEDMVLEIMGKKGVLRIEISENEIRRKAEIVNASDNSTQKGVNWTMDRMLVVVFENELKAYDGSRALRTLDSEGSISIYAEAVIKKNDDGTVTVKQGEDDFPIRTVGGTAVGSLIGLLGGPVGFAVGAVAGTFAGGILDMNRAGVSAEFLDEVSAKLTPGKWAIVAEISEEWVTPVDTSMVALGGKVYRIARKNVEHEQYAKDVAAIKADIAQLKAEQAKSRTEHKAKLQSKIDNLNKKLHAKLEQAKQRSGEQKKEAKAKVEALQKKAAKSKGEAKAKIEKRIADIKERDEEASEEFDEWLNGEGDLI